MFSTSFFALLPFVRVLLFSPYSASADVLAFANSQEYQEGAYGKYTIQTYITEPDFNVPVPNVIVSPQDGASSSQYIMWTPVGYARGQNDNGPVMLNATDLSLVYQAPEYSEPGVAAWGRESIGGTVQTCNGTDYITWWGGKGHWGRKAGRYYVLDMNYNLLYNISAVNMTYGDAHEFFLTPQCTAVFSVYHEQEHDLSMYNITDGWIIDNWFQEVNLVTNELLFEWKVSDHVNISDTYLTPNMSQQGGVDWNGMDYFHLNSIEKDHKGNFLISSRHMKALYYISGATSEILWTLGGKNNQFTDLSNGTATNFAWQHHARWTSDALDTLTLFDNRDSKFGYAADYISRGIILSLDIPAMTVKLVTEYRAPSNITAIREGSMQLIPESNGNVLLGWGNEPAFTEYTANGTIVWDVRFGPLGLDRDTADNYRALKVNWTGVPTWKPKIAAGPTNVSLLLPLAKPLHSGVNGSAPPAQDSAYFSWNGATDVAKWIILASSDNSSAVNATTDIWQEVQKSGFESNVFVGEAARYIRAVAVAGNASVLGVTDVLDMSSGNLTAMAFDAAAFEAQIAVETRRWGAAALVHLKDKWEMARANPHGSGVAGGLVLIAIVGLVAFLYVRRQRRSVGTWKVKSRKRSDTVDSKIEMGIRITVVDHDEEMRSSGENSSGYSEDGESSRYRDFEGYK